MFNSKLQLERILKKEGIGSDTEKNLQPFIDLGYIPIDVESNGMMTLFKPGKEGADYNGTLAFFITGDTDSGFFIPFDDTKNLYSALITKEIFGTLEPLTLPKTGYELDEQLGQLIVKKRETKEPEVLELINAQINRLENDKKLLPIIESELTNDFQYIMATKMNMPNKDLTGTKTVYSFLLVKDLETAIRTKILTIVEEDGVKDINGVMQIDISRLVIQKLMSCWASYEDSMDSEHYLTPEQRAEAGLYTELEEWLSSVSQMHPSRFIETVDYEGKPLATLSEKGQEALSKTQMFQRGMLKSYQEYLTNNKLSDNIHSIKEFIDDLVEVSTPIMQDTLENLATAVNTEEKN